MQIAMTVNAAYLPSWGVKEGLRELVQNWLDAGTSVNPALDGATLTLANPGHTLDRSALLIGTTSKAGKKDQRGQFGEGLKLGALALVRAGKTIAVHTGTERWTATLKQNATLGAKVLTWGIAPDSTPGIRIVVGRVTEAEWTEARALFRHFNPAEPLVAGYHGALLPDEPGRLYVKGILVEEKSKYRFGYDFAEATVDRDRRMVSGFDASWHAASMVQDAMHDNKIDATTALRMAMEGAPDVAGLIYFSQVSPARAALAQEFRRQHGELAVVCKNPADVQTCINMNEKAITLPSVLADLIGPHCRSIDDVKIAARESVIARYDDNDLSTSERDALAWAVNLTHLAFKVTVSPVVVDFRNQKCAGMFSRGEIRVARKHLADPFETLATLIHEVGHMVAQDGTREHEAVVEAGWVAIARKYIPPAPLSPADPGGTVGEGVGVWGGR